MDFNLLSDEELLKIINLKSEESYSHDQLQAVREIYINRIYKNISDEISALSNQQTSEEKTDVEENTNDKDVCFESVDDNKPVTQDETPKQCLPHDAPDTVNSPLSSHTVVFTPAAQQGKKPANFDDTKKILSKEKKEDVQTEPPVTKADTVCEEKSLFEKFYLHFLMPVISAKEIFLLCSSIYLLIYNHRNFILNAYIVSDAVYSLFIVSAWYMASKGKGKFINRILIFTEILRTLSGIFFGSMFFGTAISIIYVVILFAMLFANKIQMPHSNKKEMLS